MNTGAMWDKVAYFLRDKGHRVFCPDLPSSKKICGLEDDIEIVCKVVKGNGLRKIILAGHSYGGIVVAGVFGKMPGKIAELVFFDTAIPEDGKSLYQIMDGYAPGLVAKFRLPLEQPFTDAVHFDRKKLNAIPKKYVHCTKSEFRPVGKKALAIVQKKRGWKCFSIESDHHCMVSHPMETAKVLLGKI